jgi:dihydrofolate reductase
MSFAGSTSLPKDKPHESEDTMGKLVVTEFVTLDGVMEDPGGGEKDRFDRGGWAFQFDRGADGDTFKLAELEAADAQLLGRVTYEGFAEAWPTMEGTGEFGEKMNAMPKFVVSSTLEDPTWNNTTVLGADWPSEVAALKERYEGDILVAGSAQLVQGLLEYDLVDELHLMVFPVMLGAGKKLFADAEGTKPFGLAEAKQAGATVILVLTRDRT